MEESFAIAYAEGQRLRAFRRALFHVRGIAGDKERVWWPVPAYVELCLRRLSYDAGVFRCESLRCADRSLFALQISQTEVVCRLFAFLRSMF
jgi:hypothetical protein